MTAEPLPELPTITADAIADSLRGFRYRFDDEQALQALTDTALHQAGYRPIREHKVGPGRIDYLIGTIGVVVKVGGKTTDVGRQLRRYADHPLISELVIVCSRLGSDFEDVGVPLHVVTLLSLEVV